MAEFVDRGALGGDELCPAKPSRPIAASRLTYFGGATSVGDLDLSASPRVRTNVIASLGMGVIVDMAAHRRHNAAGAAVAGVDVSTTGTRRATGGAVVSGAATASAAARRRATARIALGLAITLSAAAWWRRRAPTPAIRSAMVLGEGRTAFLPASPRAVRVPRQIEAEVS